MALTIPRGKLQQDYSLLLKNPEIWHLSVGFLLVITVALIIIVDRFYGLDHLLLNNSTMVAIFASFLTFWIRRRRVVLEIKNTNKANVLNLTEHCTFLTCINEQNIWTLLNMSNCGTELSINRRIKSVKFVPGLRKYHKTQLAYVLDITGQAADYKTGRVLGGPHI